MKKFKSDKDYVNYLYSERNHLDKAWNQMLEQVELSGNLDRLVAGFLMTRYQVLDKEIIKRTYFKAH